eukprot:12424250-Karenia_brevis.AAC.1
MAIAEQFARAVVPADIRDAMLLGALTDLQKPDGGVRGITAGESFGRLVSKTLARQDAKEMKTA